MGAEAGAEEISEKLLKFILGKLKDSPHVQPVVLKGKGQNLLVEVLDELTKLKQGAECEECGPT